VQQAIHSEALERWLGASQIEHLQHAMRGWYADPIAVSNVPGRVLARADGDFEGKLRTGGRWSSLVDKTYERTVRLLTRAWKHDGGHLNAGFATLSALISAATTGGSQYYQFNKAGPTGVVNVTSSLWTLGNQPVAGANAGAAPGGTVPTSATTGAFSFNNQSPAFQIYVTGLANASVAPNTLLLYDRLFAVNKTMASTTTEAVTGIPSRYTNTTAGAMDYIGGNFLFVEVGGTALAATAHNWTVCQYTDQGGSTGNNLPSLTGNSGAIVQRLDHPAGQWFAPLATGDTGVAALTQMQCSASVATGVINFVIGHPIAFIPVLVANFMSLNDGINSAFNLTRIFDNAALAFLEVNKSATTATTYNGQFQTVSG
jgi:hypothetical protein